MNKTLKTSAALISALTISIAIGTTSSASETKTNATTIHSAVQTVTIAAKRLSAEQKAAYDQEQTNHAVQTVIISAKRLSPQAKIAFDKANESSFQANVQFNKALRQTV